MLTYDDLAANHTGQLRAEWARNGTFIAICVQLVAGHACSRGQITVVNIPKESDRISGVRVKGLTD